VSNAFPGGLIPSNGLAEAVQPDPTTTYFGSVDTITLGGVLMPGKWTLQPGGKDFGYQIQKGWGLSGAFANPTGEELAEADFLIELWASYQRFQMRQVTSGLLLQAMWRPSGTSSSKALGISHPELKAVGVTSVLVKRLPWFTDAGKGRWTGTIRFLQWRPPVTAPPRPNQAIPEPAPPKPTATDNQQVEIQQNDAIIKGLLGK
jgi:hypothetical protein